MRPYIFALFAIPAVFAPAQTPAPDMPLNVRFVCAGERLYVESCNIRDPSDAATCTVAFPDRPLHNGFLVTQSQTRGALRRLLPTCSQPTAQDLAAQKAFEQRQAAAQEAATRKYNPGYNPQAATQTHTQTTAATGPIAPPRNAEERAMRRCVSSGRLPATCTGNSLLGAFGQMLGQVLPGADKQPPPGPGLAGVFEGPGNWRLDFIDGGVLVNCAFLSPDQHSYHLNLASGRATLTIDTTPEPLVLTLASSTSITGPPSSVILDGVVATGVTHSAPDPNAASGYTDRNGISLTNQQAGSASEKYRGANREYGSMTPTGSSYTNFAHRRASCPAINLSSKGASTGVQTMQTNLLKGLFSDGETGPPTPSGVRMHGIFAAPSTGFSAQFFPESVILGCGPDSARAYPYTVDTSGAHPTIRIDSPEKLNLTFTADNGLDPGSSEPYQVHGRIVTGQDDNDNFTFAPMERTCNLAHLSPATAIPSSGGNAALPVATGAGPALPLATPQAPTGPAVLTLISGLNGTPSPLANHPFVLLRDPIPAILARAGFNLPAGTSPYIFIGQQCATRNPDCQRLLDAVQADSASAARSDTSGRATLPGVPPGTYYLMISTRVGAQALAWDQPVQLTAAPSTLTLTTQNATVVH